MIPFKALLFELVGVSLCMANISGIVTDTGTTPISGAIVRLEKNGLIDTTGADGSFTLSGAITVGITGRINQSLPHKLSATIHDGFLCVTIAEKSAIEVVTYNLHGQAISIMQKTMNSGTYSLALPYLGAGVYLCKVKAGESEIVLKSSSLDRVSQGTSVSVQSSFLSATLAKNVLNTVGINDVIAVTKDGFLNYREVIGNSDASGIKIKMIRCEGTLIDVDENAYQTVRIGNQVWMAENLRVTKYNDGSAIPLVTGSLIWSNLTTPGYCYYNNTTNKDSIKRYGALYNWYVVSPANLKKIAPAGWHVPTDSEWTILEKYMVQNGYNWDGTRDTSQYNEIAKSLVTKTDWKTSTTAGTIGCDLTKNNSSGFSALPGGFRQYTGSFGDNGNCCFWWSATELDAAFAFYRYFYSYYSYLYRSYYDYYKSSGFSVRLVKDN